MRAKHEQQEKLTDKPKRKPAIKHTELSGASKEMAKKPAVSSLLNKKKNISRFIIASSEENSEAETIELPAVKLLPKTKNNKMQRKDSINEKSLEQCSKVIQSVHDERKYN